MYNIPKNLACVENPILVAIFRENTTRKPRSSIAIPDNPVAFFISNDLSIEQKKEKKYKFIEPDANVSPEPKLVMHTPMSVSRASFDEGTI